jgi:transcriptional/translational regulatory protein YebC/TACO1
VLAAAIKKAKSLDVPKDHIETALAKVHLVHMSSLLFTLIIYCQATRTKDRGEQHLVLEALAAKGRVGLMM